MSDLTPSPKRRRGGQPGNINALKHGFYTRRFTQTDLAGVESTDYHGLMEEIAIIRLYARRLIELAFFGLAAGLCASGIYSFVNARFPPQTTATLKYTKIVRTEPSVKEDFPQ